MTSLRIHEFAVSSAPEADDKDERQKVTVERVEVGKVAKPQEEQHAENRQNYEDEPDPQCPVPTIEGAHPRHHDDSSLVDLFPRTRSWSLNIRKQNPLCVGIRVVSVSKRHASPPRYPLPQNHRRSPNTHARRTRAKITDAGYMSKGGM